MVGAQLLGHFELFRSKPDLTVIAYNENPYPVYFVIDNHFFGNAHPANDERYKEPMSNCCLRINPFHNSIKIAWKIDVYFPGEPIEVESEIEMGYQSSEQNYLILKFMKNKTIQAYFQNDIQNMPGQSSESN